MGWIPSGLCDSSVNIYSLSDYVFPPPPGPARRKKDKRKKRRKNKDQGTKKEKKYEQNERDRKGEVLGRGGIYVGEIVSRVEFCAENFDGDGDGDGTYRTVALD